MQTTHANTRTRVASERGRRRHVRWPDRIHRGSQAICAASFALAVVAAVRYDRAHTADGSSTGTFVPLLLTALVGVLALAVVLFRPERGEFRRHVATAASWSVALVLALAIVWAHINLTVRDVRGEAAISRLPVLNQPDVDAFLAAHLDPPAAADPLPYRIPTGVLLESVEFLSANNVRVSGYIWQKWPPGVPADITRGFTLPEAVDMADLGDPAYDVTGADGAKLIGWRVQTTLRQAFDYHHYPFDRQDVSLRLWARDLDRRVVLVPDFASYPSLDPAVLPGIDRQFVYGGWTPEHAHFSYGATRNDATMGYTARAAGFPELYFNVGLKREFLEPFLDYVIFALAVAMLLFGVLVMTVKDEASKNRIGIFTFSVIGTSGTLLFAVILRESQLRSTIDPDQIVYLETLPLLLNLAILLVALHAILHSAPPNRGRAQPGFRPNHLPTLIYWPALLGALLAVTLVVFYQ